MLSPAVLSELDAFNRSIFLFTRFPLFLFVSLSLPNLTALCILFSKPLASDYLLDSLSSPDANASLFQHREWPIT